MKIDRALLDRLTEEAKASPRLRMNFDLRDSADDQSQKMLNALEPGTEVPIHRHHGFSETVVILRGSAVQYFYDDEGNVVESVPLAPGSDCPAMVVEPERWHRLISQESGTVILECKNGPFKPLPAEDILTL